MSARFDGQFLGILGGMGPLAGASFLTRLTLLTPAHSDQQHIPAILWSDPRIPSRPAAYLGQGEDPLPWMLHGVQSMEKAGAKIIAIPCNTAHLWYRQLQENTTLPILHIVDTVIDNLRLQGVHKGLIGLLGTEATLQSGLYQERLQNQGYSCLLPDQKEIPVFCTYPIERVKDNQLKQAFQAVLPAVHALIQRGVSAVVLGCTELPLALPHEHRKELGIPVVDSIDALALASIRWYQL